MRPAEDLCRLLQLREPARAEGGTAHPRRHSVATASVGCNYDDNPVAESQRRRDGAGREDRFIVGMSMEAHKSPRTHEASMASSVVTRGHNGFDAGPTNRLLSLGRPSCLRRVLLVTDTYSPKVGGIETHVGALARQLVAAGVDVDVLTASPGASRASRRGEPDPGGAGQYRELRIDQRFVPLWAAIFVNSRRVGRVIDDGAYDLVHVHAGIGSPLSYGVAFMSQARGVPTVVTTHSVWGQFTRLLPIFDAAFGWTSWPVMFTAVSRQTVQRIAGRFAERDVALLPNGMDTKFWRRDNERDTQRSVGSRTIEIVSVMRLQRRKRPHALVKIIGEVADRVSPGVRIRATIIGDGPRRASLQRQIGRLGLDGTIRLVGWRNPEGVRAALHASDIFAIASDFEAFGLAALEARAAGLPVVAKRDSGIAEFIAHGRNGLLAATDDDMVSHLTAMIKDYDARLRISSANMRDDCRFDWAAMLDLHFETYRSAMAMTNGLPTVDGAVSAIPAADPAQAAQQ